MLKHYKNLSGVKLDVTLYGVGRVEIPADAACIPLESSTAAVLNKAAFPNVVLEEVEVTYTAVDNPVIKTEDVPMVMSEPTPEAENVLDVVENNDELVEIEDLEDGIEGAVNPIDAYTKAELVALCEERGIAVVARDTKADLYAKLF
jgi:hypothetical protein